MFEYDATTTRILEMPPYFFFTVIGVVFSTSLYILLLLKYDYDIPRYTKIFLISSGGLLIGARLLGALSGLYKALAGGESITMGTFLNTGIVFYGGLIGFVLTFLLICKMWNKGVDCGMLDLVAVCIPLFHAFARVGCFFAGCCYGIETDSWFSVLYTNHVNHEVFTALRLPIQLAEAVASVVIFVVLLLLLFKNKLKYHLLKVYLLIYAIMRIALELFRGDEARGVWNGISFSQIVSALIICICVGLITKSQRREKYEVH